MRANHVHLLVADPDRSAEFYGRWFGFVEGMEYGDVRFLLSPSGFELALSLDPDFRPLPSWFHWGFKAGDRAEVRRLYQEMVAADVPVTRALLEDDQMVSFRCADPDGHSIEIYWVAWDGVEAD